MVSANHGTFKAKIDVSFEKPKPKPSKEDEAPKGVVEPLGHGELVKKFKQGVDS